MEREGVKAWGKGGEMRKKRRRKENVVLGGGGGFPDTRFDPAENR